jgi:hypothetical protein
MTVAAPLKQQPLEFEQWLNLLAKKPVFLLAETTLNQAVRRIAEAQHVQSADARLYWDELGRVHASVSPYLVRARPSNWPKLHEHICSQPGWGMALVLDGPILAHEATPQLKLLMRHLRTWTWIAEQHNPAQGQLMRIGDWQVVETLLGASTVAEQSALFGPIAAMVCVEGQAITQYQPVALEPWQPWDEARPRPLSEAQYQALSALGLASSTRDFINHLHDHHRVTQEWHDEQMQTFLETHLAHAKDYGLLSKQDQVKYLTLAVLFGDEFDRQAWAKAEFDAPRQGAQTLMQRLYRAAEDQLDMAKASQDKEQTV